MTLYGALYITIYGNPTMPGFTYSNTCIYTAALITFLIHCLAVHVHILEQDYMYEVKHVTPSKHIIGFLSGGCLLSVGLSSATNPKPKGQPSHCLLTRQT